MDAQTVIALCAVFSVVIGIVGLTRKDRPKLKRTASEQRKNRVRLQANPV